MFLDSSPIYDRNSAQLCGIVFLDSRLMDSEKIHLYIQFFAEVK